MSTSETIRKANLRVTPGFVMSRLHRSVPIEAIPSAMPPVTYAITRDLFAIRSIEEFVEQAYRVVLRRSADAGGALEYCQQLSSGNLSRSDVVNILRRSDEGRAYRPRIEGVGLRLRLLAARWRRKWGLAKLSRKLDRLVRRSSR